MNVLELAQRLVPGNVRPCLDGCCVLLRGHPRLEYKATGALFSCLQGTDHMLEIAASVESKKKVFFHEIVRAYVILSKRKSEHVMINMFFSSDRVKGYEGNEC